MPSWVPLGPLQLQATAHMALSLLCMALVFSFVMKHSLACVTDARGRKNEALSSAK